MARRSESRTRAYIQNRSFALDPVGQLTSQSSGMKHAFVVDITADPRCMRDLEVGGVYIAGAAVAFDDLCHLVLRAGTEELSVQARAVLVTDDGVGLQIEELTGEVRARIAALVEIAKYVDLE